MELWLIIAGVVLLLGLLYLVQAPPVEGFLNIDPPSQLAQRQMAQMEGERRYNDLGRLQNPFTSIPVDKLDAAITQVVPTAASTQTNSSLLTLLGFTEYGGHDDGSNKQGAGTEQTGMVANKINFCEGITNIDCGLLDDPRLAECGFCHRDGKNSKGKPHRGGMYISSGDQVSTNERAGKRLASYKPTVGTCKPEYFTLVNQRCSNLEKNMQCQRAGAATDSNECGQCFGAAAPGTTGLLYMGPKPKTYNATLHISHPGSYQTSDGFGITISVNGNPLSLPPAQNPVLTYNQIPLRDLKEGDQLQINLYGAPPVWTGWLSNESGTRTIGLSMGEMNIGPQGAYVIAGDSHAKIVQKYMNSSGDPASWSYFQSIIPPNVLWYERREIVQPAITAAWYGNSSDQSQALADVTDTVQMLAPLAKDFPANAGDTGARFLYMRQDTGRVLVFPSGSMVPVEDIVNSIVMIFKVPATLVDPPHDIDQQQCQTGPIVTTSVGSGLMGANSCYSADGSFNPSLSCIRRLFIGAGGTPQGKSYPQTEADAQTLAKGSLDATVDYLNDLYNKASYGSDLNGAPVTDFEVVQNASMQLFGYSLKNPCEGPSKDGGPHSELCLDYLWRTSGNPGQDSLPTDLSKLPYNYCSKDGLAAPIRSDGTINYETMNFANDQLRSIPNIRWYFQLIHGAMSSSNFNEQREGLRECLNLSISAPPPATNDCPAPNPDEWQCFGPSKVAADETFHVAPDGYTITRADAESVCASYGARVASNKDLLHAQRAGGDWCSTGWTVDSSDATFPRNSNLPPGQWGCGSPGINVYNPPGGKAGVNCHGKRPPQGDPAIRPFNASSWSNPILSQDKIEICLAVNNYVVRHENYVFYFQPYDGSMQIQQDSSLEIVDPNNGRDGYVSFRSVNIPTQYLRHSNFKILLNANDGGYSFNDDSSFKILPALSGNTDQISIQASNDTLTVNGTAIPGTNFYITYDGAPGNMILADSRNTNAVQSCFYRGPALTRSSSISATAVPLCKNLGGNIVCAANASGDTTPLYFGSESDCNTWNADWQLKNPNASPFYVPVPEGIADPVNTYLTNRS